MQGVVTGKACTASRVGSLYQQRSHARGKSLSRPFIRKFVVAFKEAEVYQPSEQSLKDTIFEVPSIGARQVVLKSEVIKESGLKPALVHRNLAPAELYEHALKYEEGTHIVSSGALATLSGEKTGRSPKDKRVVRDFESDQDIWWAGAGDASPNMEMDERTFLMNRETAISYLNTLDRIYVLDGFANWDNENRVKIRVITSRPYHALFMHNMLIRPSKVELATFGEPDFTIFNGGEFPANKYASYMTSSTSINVSLKHKQMVILGSQYAGEMKKGVFSVMQYLMPLRNILTLHSGANMGKDGDVTLFFGLSGTGKTTLSADPARPLIGDDEHCWSDAGIANIEGGCYAKTIALREEKEPDIYRALRFGALLENVVYDSSDRVVDYDSSEVTENTRASYPIEFIDNARVPCTGPHPKNIILLCCDAFGVLPPVSRLTAEQAQYHFISGYTAKVAGTEMGIKEPQATFSPCFGGAFLMLHPMRYASMLAERMAQHGTTAWLVNTGWVGGAYGVGQRIPLKYTRAIIDAIHSGSLEEGVCSYSSTPIFNLKVPDVCPGVPQTLLHPEQSWPDKAEFRETLEHLAELFHENFRKYEGSSYVSEATSHAIASGGPKPHAWWLGGDGMHRRNGSNPERS